MFQSLEKALSPLNGSHGVSTWLLRIAFAAVYIPKGFDKFIDLQGFAGMMDLAIGVAFLVALAELLGGLAVLVGGFFEDAASRHRPRRAPRAHRPPADERQRATMGRRPATSAARDRRVAVGDGSGHVRPPSANDGSPHRRPPQYRL